MSTPSKLPASIAPIAISDATALAAIGLTARQFRSWLRAAGIPHRRVGRRTLVLVEHVRAALGASAAAPVADSLDRDEIVRLASGGRR